MDLRGHLRTMDPGLQWQKMAFVLEMTGRSAESFCEAAQSSVTNARLQSLQAAFQLFRTELATDQSVHRKEMLASTGDYERRHRSLVNTLEVRKRRSWQTALCIFYFSAEHPRKSWHEQRAALCHTPGVPRHSLGPGQRVRGPNSAIVDHPHRQVVRAAAGKASAVAVCRGRKPLRRHQTAPGRAARVLGQPDDGRRPVGGQGSLAARLLDPNFVRATGQLHRCHPARQSGFGGFRFLEVQTRALGPSTRALQLVLYFRGRSTCSRPLQ